MFKPKKMLAISATVLFFGGIMTGCSKDEPSLIQTTKLVQKTADEQNVDAANVVIQRYSKVVAVALENQHFRTLLKQLALKQFDGDYDVLASDLQTQQIDSISVMDYFAQIIDARFTDEFGMAGVDFLENALQVIPNLQIAIPVNCEEWKVSETTPKVIPLLADFDDQNNTDIEAYNSEWSVSSVSLEEDPLVPYVVISISERVDKWGNFKYFNTTCKDVDTSNSTNPIAPSNLTIDFGNNANELLLTWSDVTNEYGYQIYRYTQGTNNQLLATVGLNTNIYIDSTVEAGKKYTYTVRSLNAQGQPSAFSSAASWYGSERVPGEQLSISGLKFDNKAALRQYESWIKGKPELVLHVYSGISPDSSKEIRCIDWIMPSPKRNEIAGTWWSCNIPINKWMPESYGQIWTFAWSEEDSSKDYEVSLGVKATYKDVGGNYQIGVSPSVKFNITENNNMGHICVNYWDSKSEVYNLGNGFSFKFNN